MGRPPLRLGRPKGRPQAPFQPSHENRYPFTNWSTFAPPKWSKFTPPLTYRAASIEKLGEFVTYCGLADEICHVFLATDLTPGEQRLEKSEDITVHTVTYSELLEMIAQGEFCDGMGLAALHLARARLDQADAAE